MDRFSEQLLEKRPDGSDNFKRALIFIGELLLLALLALITLWTQYQLVLLTLAAAACSIWLFKYLWDSTCIEYEYIVTNDDLDIDKIIGRRSRKRLISVSLLTVEDIAPYRNDTELKADVTVVAHDCTGENIWYLIAKTEKYGGLAVLFNPDERTRTNIIGGLDQRIKAKITNGQI